MSIILPILSVIIGFLAALILKKGAKATQLLLSFSGALLLSVTVFEFLPKVYNNFTPTTGLLIMGGVLLQVFLEFLSKGAEHGHSHGNESLKKFPVLLFIGLCIHALMEGFPIAADSHLLLGVVIHKIPVALVISLFLLSSQLKKSKIALFLIFFALMTPLGSLFNQFFIHSDVTERYIDAVVVGIFLHVSTTILFESSKDHKFNWSKIILIILGVITAYFI